MEPAVISLSNIPPHLLLLRQHLLTPPVPDAGRALWFESKITELLSSTLFRPNAIPEFFCQKHLRLGREIAEQVLFLLARDMDNPPSLEDLGREFNRSPFAISRIFSEITGETIPSALRRLRLDRAGRLLIETHKSVTEIAFEVGYSSIGSFNKAFGQHFGCVPTAYRTSRTKA
jgi:AraC-like DNA-binding protein